MDKIYDLFMNFLVIA